MAVRAWSAVNRKMGENDDCLCSENPTDRFLDGFEQLECALAILGDGCSPLFSFFGVGAQKLSSASWGVRPPKAASEHTLGIT